MSRLPVFALALATVLLPMQLSAQTSDPHAGHHSLAPGTNTAPQADELNVKNAWVRATPPGADSAAGYMELQNLGNKPLVITGVGSDAARMAMLHSMVDDNGVMRMRHLSRLTIPAQSSVKLVPGGDHLMLVGLKAPLAVGRQVAVQLSLEDGRRLDLVLPVLETAP